MTTIAERNRAIKKVLAAEFGAGKVTVRGSRGTAYGWVTVNIDRRPKNADERDTWKAKVWSIFAANNINIGTYGSPDPGSDYGYGSKIHLEFGRPLDTFEEGERVEFNGKPGKVQSANYQGGPGWYFFCPDDDNSPTVEVYKRDLIRLSAVVA